jgi:hypothetical protein
MVLVVAMLALGGCAGRKPREEPWHWTESRADDIRRSQVWLGYDLDEWVRHIRGLDLATGPGGIPPGTLVACDFVEPGKDTFSGMTPKFLCRTSEDGGRVVKVKYRAHNPELAADVAGARLFWALGFGADRVDPVRVRCAGCSDDPWSDRTRHPGAVVDFDPATIEHEFAGTTIEERPHQGFTWAEFAAIDPAAGGAPRAHTDALELLAAFVQHRDSKADNQRLLCLPDGVVGRGDRRSCRRPFMMIEDDGSFFGGSRFGVATYKMSLEHWERTPVWKDPHRCIAELASEWDATDGLTHPTISEAGRRFLATLLGALRHEQIVALFTAARAERWGALDRWVAAFEARREQIAHPVPSERDFRCPEPPTPEHR